MISKNCYYRDNRSFKDFIVKRSFSVSVTKFSYPQSLPMEADRRHNVFITCTKRLRIALLPMQPFGFGLIWLCFLRETGSQPAPRGDTIRTGQRSI